ncbi:hypothetical protein GCM10027290_43690 [Micromonospora sonneratiae]
MDEYGPGTRGQRLILLTGQADPARSDIAPDLGIDGVVGVSAGNAEHLGIQGAQLWRIPKARRRARTASLVPARTTVTTNLRCGSAVPTSQTRPEG